MNIRHDLAEKTLYPGGLWGCVGVGVGVGLGLVFSMFKDRFKPIKIELKTDTCMSVQKITRKNACSVAKNH